MPAMPAFRPFPDDPPAAHEQLGSIRNHLGILSKDYKHLHPKILTTAYSSVSDLAEMLDVQRTLLYAKTIPLKKGSVLRKRVIQLVIASDLAYELLNNDKEATFDWLIAPNTYLFGDTPFEVIMRGEAEVVINWLIERQGMQPGAAF